MAVIHAVLLFVFIQTFPVGVTSNEWWKGTIVYQIYPRSFMDSDGDGVGDLAGITSRLEYFNDIGVGTVWLNPVYKSPMADFGYDVDDFKDIDPIFGTMADFDELISKAHRLGLKLVMDFVPNHTSDQHPWFIESKKNKDSTNRYRDYYVWVDPKKNCSDPPEKCIPNNWVDLLGGTVWEWVQERQQFYLHQFLNIQPDLNYRNPVVHLEMINVLRFWLEKGVDGFRVDAVRHMYESEDLQDEPINPDYSSIRSGHVAYGSLVHSKTFDQPEVHDLIYEWRRVLNEYSMQSNYRFLTIETNDTHEILLPYYGTPSRPEADFPFNYGLTALSMETFTGSKVHQLVNDWMKDLPHDKWPNWVTGNHDCFRVADRVGIQYARALNVLNLLLPGTPKTYYGEEIGMMNTWVPFSKSQDSYAAIDPSHWKEYTRDPERSPMQWDRSSHAGFSTTIGDTWLPVNQNYLSGINVADQKADNTSALALYKKLAALRKDEPAFQTNHLKYVVVTEKIFSFLRMPDTPGLGSFLVIINAGTSESTDDYSAALMEGHQLKMEGNIGTITVSSNMDRDGVSQDMSKVSVAKGEALVVKCFC
ncbi:alpha-glucosidase-like [Patiria miniata]|uniref:Glycosyl hydrolase family 13 catalytic domain-containing protein n=1 Tax=Patiria miniata TaxID=46514 RepID=A0A913Z6Y2_PATMI|nr:alpha-glucosidase-like [Patiria miniata]